MKAPIDAAHINEATISISPDGEIAIIETDDVSSGFLLEQLGVTDSTSQSLSAEQVSLGDQMTAWVGKEGVLKELRTNRIGTGLIREVIGDGHGSEDTQTIHGPVVLTGSTDAEGKTQPLSQPQVKQLVELVQEINVR